MQKFREELVILGGGDKRDRYRPTSFIIHCRQNMRKMEEYMGLLLKREVLYKTFTEFGILLK
jgi:hypothetical protein